MVSSLSLSIELVRSPSLYSPRKGHKFGVLVGHD